MVEVTLPSGRVVDVERVDGKIRVRWTEKDVNHELLLPATLTPEQVDKECDKYLYGYDDPETGEHIPGYFDLRELATKEQSEEQWW